MSTLYSIGQMNQLGDALELAGFTPEEVTKLRNSRLLPKVRNVLLGHAEIVAPEHIIDCDADPFVPNGWLVKEHRKGGVFTWDKDAQASALYCPEEQLKGAWIVGDKLYKELSDKPVLNANVLDYLFHHQHLIPEEWKGNSVFFWGTVYNDQNNRPCVRYLRWNRVLWDHHWSWLDNNWDVRCLAAVSAS